jgi:hypothetical protein
MFRRAPGTLLLLALLMLPATATAQEQRRPLQLADVQGLLESGVSTRRILELVGQSCLGFRITAANTIVLRSNGADEELITGLNAACTRLTEGPSQPPSAPAQPPAPGASGAGDPAGAGNGPVPPGSSKGASTADGPRTIMPRYNPGAAAFKSLALPGLGQFTSGRPVMGTIFIGAAAGALAAGALSKSETVYCSTRTTDCASDDVIDTESTPKITLGIAAYAAVAAVAALDAAMGASRANRQQVAAGTAVEGRARLHLQPSLLAAGPEQVRLELVSIRF